MPSDQALLSLLASDLRQATGQLADALQISAPTVRTRLEKLLADPQLYVGPSVDIYAAGFQFVLIIGVKTTPGEADAAAQAIAALSSTIAVNRVSGEFDIEAAVVLRSRDEVSHLLFDALASIEGVEQLSPSLALDVWKFQDVELEPQDNARAEKPLLDATDQAIIEQLKQQPRLSNRKIATELDIGESTVRNRLNRMLEERQLAWSAGYRLEHNPNLSVAYIGIDVQGNQAAAVCQALAALPSSNFVATTLGKHDIMCCLRVSADAPLEQQLNEDIRSIEGVRQLTTSTPVASIKYDASLGILL